MPGAVVTGNIEEGALAMGAVAGMIKEVLPAAEIVRQIVNQYDSIVKAFRDEFFDT